LIEIEGPLSFVLDAFASNRNQQMFLKIQERKPITRTEKEKEDLLTNVERSSGGELLELRLLDTQLLYSFGRKSTARHKI
jgi:hypothetical protein